MIPLPMVSMLHLFLMVATQRNISGFRLATSSWWLFNNNPQHLQRGGKKHSRNAQQPSGCSGTEI
jgi:hypothetical protein